MAQVTLQVDGMTCGHCRETVARALRGMDGVSGVQVDLERGTATVTYDEAKTGPDAFAQAITAAGYQVKNGTGGAMATPTRRGCCCG